MPDAPAITLRPGRREDVAAIVRLLADDGLGAGREQVSDPPSPAYLAAFEAIVSNPRALLAVAEDEARAVIGTLQLTFIAGLSNQGAELALVSAVRVDSGFRACWVNLSLEGHPCLPCCRRGVSVQLVRQFGVWLRC